jgi:hypothetical protein
MNTLIAQATVSTAGEAGGGSPAIVIVWLVVVVAMIAAMWKLFAKAGKPGWAAIIPIYNTVTLLQITGKSGWWLLGMCVPFLNIYVYIRLVFNLATVYGRGLGFGFGLLFLFPIFVLILGFGSAQYIGANGGRASSIAAGGLTRDSLAA